MPCEDGDTSSSGGSSGGTSGGSGHSTDPDEPTPGGTEGEPTYGNPYMINDCECEVYADAKKPGGCVNVNDTQLGLRGVRNVKVIIKDDWYRAYTVRTDHNGCLS